MELNQLVLSAHESFVISSIHSFMKQNIYWVIEHHTSLNLSCYQFSVASNFILGILKFEKNLF